MVVAQFEFKLSHSPLAAPSKQKPPSDIGADSVSCGSGVDEIPEAIINLLKRGSGHATAKQSESGEPSVAEP